MGTSFHETVEQQKWLDRALIDQTIMKIYMELGHCDEKLTSTYQQLTVDMEAKKQRSRPLSSWASGALSSERKYKELMSRAKEYCDTVQKDTETSSPEKLKFYQTVKGVYDALCELEGMYQEEIDTFTKTAQETKKITAQYISHTLQKAKRFSNELKESKDQNVAENERWKTTQQIEWSERHHRFLTTLDRWIHSFTAYQNATIALISIHPTLKPKTAVFRGLAKEFRSILPNHHFVNTQQPQQHNVYKVHSNVHVTMMHETVDRDSDRPMTKRMWRVVSQWISLVTPIANEIREYRRSIQRKISAMESKSAEMKNKEELNHQIIRETHAEQEKYYQSITRAKKIEPEVLQNHQKIKMGLVELENRQRKASEERKKLNRELEFLIRLHKNTAVSPPENILESLSEEENQLMLQKTVIADVMERNQVQMTENHRYRVDRYIQGATEKISSDIGTLVKERDQLFAESLMRVNPDNMGGKEIISYFSNLEYVGKVLKEPMTQLQLFGLTYQALIDHYFSTIQKAIVGMNTN